MFCTSFLFLIAALGGAKALPNATASPAVGSDNALPIVDLGYSRYRAVAVNTTGQYYNFSNIRYAAAPLGNLRWRAPQYPPLDRRSVQDGSLGFICPQAPPLWFDQGQKDLGDLAKVIPDAPSSQAESEDCLFLDVIVPTKLFERRGSKRGLAPVLFNIHGGGFWIGEKRALYPPNGLLEAGDNGFIYVSINYRVGPSDTRCVSLISDDYSWLRLGSYRTWCNRLLM